MARRIANTLQARSPNLPTETVDINKQTSCARRPQWGESRPIAGGKRPFRPICSTSCARRRANHQPPSYKRRRAALVAGSGRPPTQNQPVLAGCSQLRQARKTSMNRRLCVNPLPASPSLPTGSVDRTPVAQRTISIEIDAFARSAHRGPKPLGQQPREPAPKAGTHPYSVPSRLPSSRIAPGNQPVRRRNLDKFKVQARACRIFKQAVESPMNRGLGEISPRHSPGLPTDAVGKRKTETRECRPARGDCRAR